MGVSDTPDGRLKQHSRNFCCIRSLNIPLNGKRVDARNFIKYYKKKFFSLLFKITLSMHLSISRIVS